MYTLNMFLLNIRSIRHLKNKEEVSISLNGNKYCINRWHSSTGASRHRENQLVTVDCNINESPSMSKSWKKGKRRTCASKDMNVKSSVLIYLWQLCFFFVYVFKIVNVFYITQVYLYVKSTKKFPKQNNFWQEIVICSSNNCLWTASIRSHLHDHTAFIIFTNRIVIFVVDFK